MYFDTLLLIIGSALSLAAVILLVVLLRFRKHGKEYKRLINEEATHIDVLGTVRNAQTSASMAYPPVGTAIQDLTSVETELLFHHACAPESRCKTELLMQNTEATELLSHDAVPIPADSPVAPGLDVSPLAGKYQLIRELGGGGMSRVFLARHSKLGNEWLVKYIDRRVAGLSNEAEVLKKLNHISLPQIIDVFEGSDGVFLVERYIEGCTLKDALDLGEPIREGQICEWGIQLSQVLSYLHGLDTPIIHCDLKPANIMLTHDDRIVLIDFGISKRQGIDERSIGLTMDYAAPEQFRGAQRDGAATRRRFGGLPPEQQGWRIDERTDIFSVGAILFQLLTGELPDASNLHKLRQCATPKMAAAVGRCLCLDPAARFQTAAELTEALESVKNQRLDMVRRLSAQRVAAVCCALALTGGVGSTASGVYINRLENASIVDMAPIKAVVSAQRSVELRLQKQRPDGEIVLMDAGELKWSDAGDNIARIDGDRLIGVNVGETTLHGTWRRQTVTLEVTVMEPIRQEVELALSYVDGARVDVFAGSGERETRDGTLADCSFASPEYLCAADGAVYVTDSGAVRVIKDGAARTLPIEPFYLTADKVCEHDGTLYIVTGPWEDDDGSYYGIARLTEGGAELLFETEAAWTVITDFAFSGDGTLWFLQQNLGDGTTALYALSPSGGEPVWRLDLPEGASHMAFDASDNLYISVPEDGVILRVDRGADSWQYFAGVSGERHFIDGTAPRFFRPTSLAVYGGDLYVLDFDTVRRIAIDGATVLRAETLAGVPEADTKPQIVLGDGGEATLAASELATLTVDSGGVLLSDPKNSVIYRVGIPAAG